MINLTPRKLLNLYGIFMRDYEKYGKDNYDKDGQKILREYADKNCIVAFGNKPNKTTLIFIIKTKEEYKAYFSILRSSWNKDDKYIINSFLDIFKFMRSANYYKYKNNKSLYSFINKCFKKSSDKIIIDQVEYNKFIELVKVFDQFYELQKNG